MNYRVLLSGASLLCLCALLVSLSPDALAGQGCGTNWMGDTSGDTDFYVSRNQNLGTSSSTASSGSTGPSVVLGKAAAGPVIEGLEPDRPSPQPPGSAIVWTARANGRAPLLYDFLLKGPATDGQLKDMTGWTGQSTWTWNTTDEDLGESLVEVRVKDPDGSSASRSESFVIEAAGEASGEGSTKPRLAPDERPRSSSDNIMGPNMNMPDPRPIEARQAEEAAKAEQTEASPEVTQPDVMDVDGKWTVKLLDTGASMDLILIQTGGSVTGYGNLNDASGKLSLMAKGTANENSLSLDVKTIVGEYVNKIDRRFELELEKVDRSISGTYREYSGEELVGSGNATASRFAA